MSSRREKLPADLLEALRSNLDGVEVITTISQGRPNWIDRVEPEGVYVETESSRKKGVGSQLVPAWMIAAAWEHLTSTCSLTNEELVSEAGLNAKRSAAVCALLARLDGVEVVTSRPIKLHYRRAAGSG